MRVLQVNKFLYRRGGAEAYMLDLAVGLQDLGDAVAFWGMRHPANPAYEYENLFVSETDFESPPEDLPSRALMAGRLLYSFSARRRLARVVDDFGPDVVHCHNVYHQLSPSILAAAGRRGATVLMTLHDYKLACPVYRFLNDEGICEACTGGHWYEATKRRCTRGMVGPSVLNSAEAYLHHGLGLYTRHVDLFVSPSRFLADKVVAAGIPAGQIEVVPNFADADRVEAQFGGDGVTFAGRLSPEKGVHTLVDAVGRVPDLRLDVYGSGPSEDDLRQLANEVAPGRVVFHGRRPAGDVAAAMAAAAAVAVPSEWYENCPLVVLEAMAAGTPVIGTRLGGVPELVEDGIDGVLVPAGDPAAMAAALRDVCTDRAVSATMGRAGRAKIDARYRKEAHVAQIRDLYRNVPRSGTGSSSRRSGASADERSAP